MHLCTGVSELCKKEAEQATGPSQGAAVLMASASVSSWLTVSWKMDGPFLLEATFGHGHGSRMQTGALSFSNAQVL